MIKATIYVATFPLSLVSFLGVPPVPILSPLSYILYHGGDNNDDPPLLLSVTIIMLMYLAAGGGDDDAEDGDGGGHDDHDLPQVFHYCQPGGRVDSFFCPNLTLFNQQYFVCDW